MTDQADEMKQLEIENDIALTLEDLYGLLMNWDGDGHGALAEEMTGFVAEWKAKLDGDEGSVGNFVDDLDGDLLDDDEDELEDSGDDEEDDEEEDEDD